MGAVLLTGATGFVGKEILNRFLDRGADVYALVRAEDDHAAAERLPPHARLTAVAGDMSGPASAWRRRPPSGWPTRSRRWSTARRPSRSTSRSRSRAA